MSRWHHWAVPGFAIAAIASSLLLGGCGFNVDGRSGKVAFCDVVTMKCREIK